MKPKYIYLAAPYTNPDPVMNTREVILAADILATRGYYPYVPHLILFWHLLHPHQVEFWYKFDLAWLLKCDTLIRLSGKSEGADKEVKFAEEHGIKVCFGLHAFLDAMDEAIEQTDTIRDMVGE